MYVHLASALNLIHSSLRSAFYIHCIPQEMPPTTHHINCVFDSLLPSMKAFEIVFGGQEKGFRFLSELPPSI